MSSLQELVLPSGIVTLLLLAGLALLAFRRQRHRAWLPLASGAALYLACSNGLVVALLTSPLEYAYPALRDPGQYPDSRVIIVLTGYGSYDRYMSSSSLLNNTSAFRVIETVFVFKKRPDCEVIVAGASTAAAIMAEHLQRLGIPPAQLTIEGGARHTAESAARLHERLAGRSVFLVTSAGHMRRAMGAFLKQGIRAIPAPTDYQMPRRLRSASWTESPRHLRIADQVVREYFALAWYHLNGRI